MEKNLSLTHKIILWSSRLVAALIMLQTLWFKFSGAEESVYIFTKVGMEPWGRVLTGVAELVASVMILIPAISWLGAFLGAGIMVGAILTHVTVLGISVKNDGGYLFALAWITLIACSIILVIQRRSIPYLDKIFSAK